ncbi:MAG: enoyl-CoA hydratase-related protein [Deltaproteobacteria bacterium]|nr:enoyl-CoA hydratase-related protein [Deltaproteobacteria bacterium]
MAESYKTLLVDAAGPVRMVLVNRPAVLNALDSHVLQELGHCFRALATDPDLRCVILSGAGEKAFVAGADIAAMSKLTPWQARAFAAAGHETAAAIESLPVPVIAAVNGFALGGGLELALCADFIYASAKAKLGFPEVGLGVIPGFGGTHRLATRVGIGRAREMIYTGRVITAAEAAAWGLANAVTEPESLLTTVQALAATIASKSPLGVAEAKRAMRISQGLPLERALVMEQELFAGLFATEDQKEGMAAFLEKRAPSFRGR